MRGIASDSQLVVYAALAYLSASSGAQLVLARGTQALRLGQATSVLAVVVAVPSVIGLLAPKVMHALERDASRVAELLMGGRRTALTFLAVGALAQLPALAWQPVGAGNSVANFGLAGTVALVVLLDRRSPGPATVAAVLTLLGGIMLTAIADVHGPAVLLGAASVVPRLVGGAEG